MSTHLVNRTVWFPRQKNPVLYDKILLDKAMHLWYTHIRRWQDMAPSKSKTRKTKGTNDMTPTAEQTTTETKTPVLKIQRTVFDLASFDDVKLVKEIPLPTPVTSVEEALAAVQNDTAKLLAVINKGLQDSVREAEYNNITGFKLVNDEGETTDQEYAGKFADESKSKLINAAVLNLAKMFSGGSWDSSNKEQKKAYKEQAIGMLRSNPAMLASIQG